MTKAFVFPGQGSQIVGMAKEFYDNFDVAKDVFKEVDEVLKKSLSQIMFEGSQELLAQTENAQPAIMCASIAILKVLEKESNKKIDNLCNFTAGHSLGEYSALCASNSISLSDSAKLLKVRGESFANAESGSMCVLLGVTIEQAEEIINKAKQKNEILQIANDNTVGQIVISGNKNSIDEAIRISPEISVKKAIKLGVSGAFHSELMKSAVTNMENVLNDVKINIPNVNFVSNFTAKITNSESEIKTNLLKQIAGRVRWRETMLLFAENGVDEIIEIGSGKVLSGMVSKTLSEVKAFSISNIENLKEFLDRL